MDEAGRDKLWKNYISTRSAEYRDELIVEYAQLVKLVAGRLNMYLGYNVEYDDLVGYGILDLLMLLINMIICFVSPVFCLSKSCYPLFIYWMFAERPIGLQKKRSLIVLLRWYKQWSFL